MSDRIERDVIEDMIKARRITIGGCQALAKGEPNEDYKAYAHSLIESAERDIELLERILRMADDRRNKMV